MVGLIPINTVAPKRSAMRELTAPPDIQSLSTAIVKGSESAFATFYELYSGRLFGLLLVMSGGREELAREVHQVVMIKATRKFRVFGSDAELWAWLAQVARHAYVDYWRRQDRHALPGVQDDLELAASAPDSGVEKELLEWLDEGLEALDAEELDLVEHIYFQGCGQQALADKYGHTRKAIESKLARIREKLRQFILRRIKYERKSTR